MVKNTKRVSIYKMKRVAQIPESEIFFQLKQYDMFHDNVLETRTRFEAFIVHGLFIYKTVSDASQNDCLQTMCERWEFVSEDALEVYLNRCKINNKRFSLDDVLYGDEKCTIDRSIKMQISHATLI